MKLIVIDGVDCSGKETQTKMLYNRLSDEGIPVRHIEFPNYNSPSSALVKMYLGGEFGTNPFDVNPYTASSFYAVDRVASYLKEWKNDYLNGTVILADRYVTSNAIHQAVKLNGKEKDEFLQWLYDFEYNKLAIPKPTLTLFLDMPFHHILNLKAKRNEGKNEDIHESDAEFLRNSYINACYCCEKLSWTHVNCVSNNEIFGREVMSDKIYDIVKKVI